MSTCAQDEKPAAKPAAKAAAKKEESDDDDDDDDDDEDEEEEEEKPAPKRKAEADEVRAGLGHGRRRCDAGLFRGAGNGWSVVHGTACTQAQGGRGEGGANRGMDGAAAGQG